MFDTSGLMFHWVMDQIPLWVWILLGLGIAGAAFFYASPILVPLWKITPTPIKIALGFVGSIFLAIMYGRYKGGKDERDMEARRNAQALQKRSEVEHEIDKLDKPAVDKRLDRWTRD